MVFPKSDFGSAGKTPPRSAQSGSTSGQTPSSYPVQPGSSSGQTPSSCPVQFHELQEFETPMPHTNPGKTSFNFGRQI